MSILSPLHFYILRHRNHILFYGLLLFFFLVPSLANAQPKKPQGAVFDIKVLKVIDGDTIRLEDGRLVRYLGIDAPEVRRKVGGKWVYDPEPFSEEATALNRKLVEGKTVRLQIDPVRPRDRFGRLLAYVFVETDRKYFVNVEMLKQGLAKTHKLPLGTEHRKMLWSAEQMAWGNKRGVWSEKK
ncbi:MAG: thermonuclease family protein [Nitrospiria bacterium]